MAFNEAQASWENCPFVDTSDTSVWANIHPDGLACSGSICALRCADGYQSTAPLKAKCQQADGEWEWNKSALGKCVSCKEPVTNDPFVNLSCKINGRKLCSLYSIDQNKTIIKVNRPLLSNCSTVSGQSERFYNIFSIMV